MVLLAIRTMGDYISMPVYAPTTAIKWQFKAKRAKYHNISETINRIKTKFEDQAETGKDGASKNSKSPRQRITGRCSVVRQKSIGK